MREVPTRVVAGEGVLVEVSRDRVHGPPSSREAARPPSRRAGRSCVRGWPRRSGGNGHGVSLRGLDGLGGAPPARDQEGDDRPGARGRRARRGDRGGLSPASGPGRTSGPPSEPEGGPLRVSREADRAPGLETLPPRRLRLRRLGSGPPASPIGDRLRLLPSGPDLVHGPTSRGTRAVNVAAGALTRWPRPSYRGFSLARADCEQQGAATSPPSTVLHAA